METIKVNMTPCEDIKTIHASQNDNEAREWGFELHNNGEKIDSSSISDQLVFKAYEGGTEQILPENGSTPTTSPFKGDIKYPQGLLSDQEFLYRESPTEEDGLAKITDIKGNTLVWNQLIRNGNFADTSIWSVTGSGSSFTVSNNIATITASGAYDRIQQNVEFINGHKYLFKADIKKTNANDDIRFYYGNHVGGGNYVFANTTEWQTVCVIKTATENITTTYPNVEGTTSNLTWQQRNMMIIDLTQMGLDISSPSDFTSLFPLPYYDYNQGTLLSFNGNGIKTVGKNRFNKDTITPSSRISANGEIFSSNASDLSDYVDVGAYDTVTVSYDYIALVSTNTRDFCFFDSNKNYLGVASYYPTNKTFTLNVQDCHYLRITFDKNVTDIQIEGGSKTSYEPYTSSTLSLPISTYFSNGMKSAGSVYDELTETKAITRVGSVDLGSLTWTMYSVTQGNLFRSPNLNAIGYALQYDSTNLLCAKYPTVKASLRTDKSISVGSNNCVDIIDSSFSDAVAFKQSLQGVYLYFELATYTEIAFTTASLVTENGETPLSKEDGVLIGKCTEQLSNESGFFDAKIKLSDADGTCYSNKLQLHVERKPS